MEGLSTYRLTTRSRTRSSCATLATEPTCSTIRAHGDRASGWGGMVVPKATPGEVVRKISADVGRILNDATMQQRIIERGAVPDVRGPKEWTAFVNAELAKWADIARRANVKAE